jgi:multiple sugar transport system substrate-binding protein
MEREKGLTGMRLSRRDLLRGLVSMGLGAGALSTLTACGAQPAPATQAPASKEQPTEAPKQEAPTQAAATPAPATATKITYWTFWADRWGEFQGQIIDAFNKSQSEIQVEMLIAPWGELNTKLLTAISAGQPPDFTIIGRSDAIEYALRGGILPLDDRIASDSRVKPDDWFEVAWKEVQWRGKIYALPFESGTYAAWLNVDLFKEVGLDPAKPPITWSETDIAADKLTKGDATNGYDRLGFVPWQDRIDILGWLAGGEWYDDAAEKITAATPENIAAFEWIKKYADKYGGEAVERFRQGLGGGMTADDPFFRGKLGMVLNGSWVMSSKNEYAPDLKYYVWPMPYKDGGKQASINQGSACVLPKGSPHPDAAFKLLVFMAIDGIAMWVPMAADMVSRKDQTSIYPKALPDTPEGHAFWKVYNDALLYAHHEPLMPVRAFWNSQLNNARDNVVLGKMSPQQALQEAQDATQKELDKALKA